MARHTVHPGLMAPWSVTAAGSQVGHWLNKAQFVRLRGSLRLRTVIVQFEGQRGRWRGRSRVRSGSKNEHSAYLRPPSLRIPCTSQPGGVAALVCCEHPAVREDSTEPLRLTHPLPARCEAQLSETAALSHTILVLLRSRSRALRLNVATPPRGRQVSICPTRVR